MKATRPRLRPRREITRARTITSPRLRRRAWRLLAALTLGLPAGRATAPPPPPPHPEMGQRISLDGVDWARPVFRTTFDHAEDLQPWKLEGGRRMSIAQGRLVLESTPGDRDNHLVCWSRTWFRWPTTTMAGPTDRCGRTRAGSRCDRWDTRSAVTTTGCGSSRAIRGRGDRPRSGPARPPARRVQSSNEALTRGAFQPGNGSGVLGATASLGQGFPALNTSMSSSASILAKVSLICSSLAHTRRLLRPR